MLHLVRLFQTITRFRHIWLALPVLCSMAGLCVAGPAEQRYRFDSWTTDNGLPQISVNSIYQTRDGFLWFSTFGGLVRYDGLRFQVFNTGNTPGLRSGRFVQIIEDSSATLWVTTEAQGVTRYKDAQFSSYTIEDGLPSNQIDLMTTDADGGILFRSGVKWVRWKDNAFQTAEAPPDQSMINYLCRSPNTGVWYREGEHVRKRENGVDVFDIDPGFPVRRAFEDSRGRLWMSTDDDQLYILENGVITKATAVEGYGNWGFWMAFEDRDHRIWFGLRNNRGIAILDHDKFTEYTAKDGLINNGVQNIYQDREGTMWIGTAGGLSRITEQVITPYSTDDGLAANNVYPIYEDHTGRILIGSWFGLTIYENGRFQDVTKQFGLENEQVTSLAGDPDGTIWVGTWGAGVRRIRNGVVTVIPKEDLGGSQARAIFRDRSGTLWFGTADGLISLRNGVYTKFTSRDGLSDNVISTIFEDSIGRLWLGTNSGVSKLENGVFTAYKETDGIERNIVRSFYEDASGTLWIGMYDSGLYRLRDGKFTHYLSKDGLYDNGVFRIIEDGAANFWISCNLGIYRVKKEELNDFAEGRTSAVSSIPYNRRDGMLNSECNGGGQPAGILARDGRIWFPTQKGVAVISPSTVPFNPQPPPVVIESLVIDASPVAIQPLIKLEPGQSNLELHYSGLSFINPELVKFKYKLIGLDDDWTDAGTRRTAYYPHLPAGDYTFTVLAANRDGVWNQQGASIKIRVLPAFWQTWWFLSFIVVAIALLIYAIYRYRIGQLKSAHAAKEAFAHQLIESQENERRRIAAELHDSLGQSLVLIKNWALLGIKAVGENDSSKANLDEISTTASQAINDVREIAYNLGPYQLERLGLNMTIKEMVQKVADSSSIALTASLGDIDNCIDRKSEISLFRILQEAISNILKHSGATTAHLEIVRGDGVVSLVIRDNGKGFDTQAPANGFGLLGMAERVGFMNGELTINSGKGKGTQIEVIVPFNNHNG